ncbi:MAG: hypothetical protein ABI873_01085 [Marmoricola sp.]
MVLTPEQAVDLAEGLVASADEILPPKAWDLHAFEVVFGHKVEPQNARTAADLARHAKALSDERQAGTRTAGRTEVERTEGAGR